MNSYHSLQVATILSTISSVLLCVLCVSVVYFPIVRLVHRPKAVAGDVDEHVLQRRLAERDRFDRGRGTPRRVGGSIRGRPAARAGPSRRRSSARHGIARSIAAARTAGSLVRIVIASPPTAARKCGRRVERGQLAPVHDGDAVGPLGFFQQVRREHDRHAVLVANLLRSIATGRCERPGSRPVDGSSSSSSRGRCSMPLASSTRRRRPPESVSTRSRLRSARPRRVSISSARARSSLPPRPYSRPWWSRFSSTVSFLSRLGA